MTSPPAFMPSKGAIHRSFHLWHQKSWLNLAITSLFSQYDQRAERGLFARGWINICDYISSNFKWIWSQWKIPANIPMWDQSQTPVWDQNRRTLISASSDCGPLQTPRKWEPPRQNPATNPWSSRLAEIWDFQNPEPRKDSEVQPCPQGSWTLKYGGRLD